MKNLTLPDGRILEIKIEDDSGLKKSAEIKGEDKTLYLSWSFDNQTGNLELEYEHRNDLPAWIKIPEKEHCEFDQRKGIPTIQVLKAMIINALECTGKVKSISVRSTNARTTTDVVYSTFVEKKDFKTACEHSTTALLAREAGEMCGTSVQLTEVEGRKSCQVTEKNFIDRISKRNLSSPSDQSTPQKYLGEDKIKTILECMGTATWTIYQEIDMRFEAIHA
ncbi:MAG: hypothetical protein KGI80_04275 [Verrucomicrobiota bacterium]|nr:hypothetical protein [Verrucomicrobiota bacterium]